MDTRLSVIDALQFVKVATTHNGKPSNIQQSGHLTELSCKMLIVELEQCGYKIVEVRSR